MPVAGDPEAIQAHGHRVGAAAAAVHSQGRDVATARSQLGPEVFAGPAGDRVRAFLDQLHRVSTTAAKALDRVASAMPGVARAVEEAQKDETLRNQARDRYHKAQGVYERAAQAVTRAAGEVIAAAGAVESATTVAAVDPTHGSGAVAAAQGHLRDAERRLERAQHQAKVDHHLMDEAQRDFQRAQHRFQLADQARRQALRKFALLCAAEEAATTGCALPTVPEPGSLPVSVDDTLGLVNTLLTLESIPAAARTDLRTAVTSVDGPDGLPAGDDLPSVFGAAGDYATSIDPRAPLSSKILAWINEFGLTGAPFSPGARALAAVTGAAQAGQALAQADPCDAPLVPPPSSTEPPADGPPPGRPPSGPHPVSTFDNIISTGEHALGKVAGPVAAGGAAAVGAAKALGDDAGQLAGEAGPALGEVAQLLGDVPVPLP